MSESLKNEILGFYNHAKQLWTEFKACADKRSETALRKLSHIEEQLSYMDKYAIRILSEQNKTDKHNVYSRIYVLRDITKDSYRAWDRKIVFSFMIVNVTGIEKHISMALRITGVNIDNNGVAITAPGMVVPMSANYREGDILSYGANPRDYLDYRYLPTDVGKFESISECTDFSLNGISRGQDDSYHPILFLGVELEVEKHAATPEDIMRRVIQQDLGYEFAMIKSDGSLNNGFEIVTAPATLSFHLKAWNKFFDQSAKLVKSYSSGRCGMHVHMSRDAFTPLHMGKLIAFYNNPVNRPFVEAVAGRPGNGYAQFNPDHAMVKKLTGPLLKGTKRENLNTDLTISSVQYDKLNNTKNTMTPGSGYNRGSVVNLTKGPTIEIRIFRGNVSKVGMMKNIEFVHAVYEFTRLASYRPVSLLKAGERVESYGLVVSDFLAWLSSDTSPNYNNLKLWLSNSNYIKKRRAEKTNTPKEFQKFTIKQEEILKCA